MDDNKEVEIETVSIDDANIANDNAPAPDATPADDTAIKLAELNDKYLRAVAELENTRRRAALDAENAARNRAMNIAGKFLPVMDAVDAALKLSPDDAGIQSMARALDAVFAQIGVVRIESMGQILNPQFHNAIQVVPAPDGEQIAPNTIVTELQPGYMFGDNVLRTAMVVVSK